MNIYKYLLTILSMYVIKYVVLIYLGLPNLSADRRSFTVSFQKETNGPVSAISNSWIELSEKMPQAKEFTMCHWLKIRFHNLDIAACLWSYCTIENVGETMKCLQVCLHAIKESANRNLRIEGEIPLQTYRQTQRVTKPLKSYRHRTWTHLCWSFSAITGRSVFYHDGQYLGMDELNITKDDWAIKGSNVTYDSAFIFGQEPDILRGGFDKHQAYFGDLSQFQIWDYTLDYSDVLDIARCKKWPKGNIVTWDQSSFIVNYDCLHPRAHFTSYYFKSIFFKF